MTAHPAQDEFITSAGGFDTARAQYIEAFVRLEAQLAAILIAHKTESDPRQPFAAKVAALCALSGNGLSKKAIERFRKVKEETARFVRIRNDLVHGLMSHVTHEGQTKAAFQNAADIASNTPQFTIISIDEMRSDRRLMRELTNQLKQLANPPSLPQPLPGAAGGL
jgi:hypothetical protein